MVTGYAVPGKAGGNDVPGRHYAIGPAPISLLIEFVSIRATEQVAILFIANASCRFVRFVGKKTKICGQQNIRGHLVALARFPYPHKV